MTGLVDRIELTDSGGGSDTCISAGFGDKTTSTGACSTEGVGIADKGHGGAGGRGCGSDVSNGSVESGASGISSRLGEGGMRLGSSSASFISTSASGAGSLCSGGIVSLASSTFVVGASVEASSIGVSSTSATVGTGEGLFDVTSFKTGDRASVLTDADRLRSLCSLSSRAC